MDEYRNKTVLHTLSSCGFNIFKLFFFYVHQELVETKTPSGNSVKIFASKETQTKLDSLRTSESVGGKKKT